MWPRCRCRGNTVFTTETHPGIQCRAKLPYSGSDMRADEKDDPEYYGSPGYADARVDDHSEYRPGPREDHHGVTEGSKFPRQPHQHLRQQRHRGQRSSVIEIIVAPGRLNGETRTSRTRLEQLNRFSSVDVRTNNTLSPTTGH